jgi:hypothetical protein
VIFFAIPSGDRKPSIEFAVAIAYLQELLFGFAAFWTEVGGVRVLQGRTAHILLSPGAVPHLFFSVVDRELVPGAIDERGLRVPRAEPSEGGPIRKRNAIVSACLPWVSR